MKQTGIVRKLDGLGRIVVPVEVRRVLGWTGATHLEITQFGRYILLHEQENSKAAPVEFRQGSPVLQEIAEVLKELPDEDVLLALHILRRLARTPQSF